jgi:hypothetical protein
MEQQDIEDIFYSPTTGTPRAHSSSPNIPYEAQKSLVSKFSPSTEIIGLAWDLLPFAEEVVIIDPTKAYFSALPTELKMEILDVFCQRYTREFGPLSARGRKCVITPNSEDVYALKSLRL